MCGKDVRRTATVFVNCVIFSLGNLSFLLNQYFQGRAFGQVRPPEDNLEIRERSLPVLFKEVRIPSNDHEAQLVKPLDDCEISSDVVRHVMELDSNLEHVGQGAAVSKGHFTVISVSFDCQCYSPFHPLYHRIELSAFNVHLWHIKVHWKHVENTKSQLFPDKPSGS